MALRSTFPRKGGSLTAGNDDFRICPRGKIPFGIQYLNDVPSSRMLRVLTVTTDELFVQSLSEKRAPSRTALRKGVNVSVR